MNLEFAKKEEILRELYSGQIQPRHIPKKECRTLVDVSAGITELVPVPQVFTAEIGKKVKCLVCHSAVGSSCYRLGNCQDTELCKYVHVKCLGCTQCGNVAKTYVLEQDGRIRCGGCAKTCGSCGGSLIGGTCLVALGQNWHPGCLTCVQCQAPLTDECIEYQGKAYCPGEGGLCLLKSFGVVCNSCGGQIDDNCTTLFGKCYHVYCVSCYRCHKPIDGLNFYPIYGQPCCDKCAKEYFQEM